jgi:CHAT domain-containing protein
VTARELADTAAEAAEASNRAFAERACRLVDMGQLPDDDGPGDGLLALAWALKDECYAAWSSGPQRVARAAQVLAALAARDSPAASPAPQARELAALAAWTAGIADLTQGRMPQALLRFEHAEALFRGLGQDGPATQTLVPRIMALSMLGRYADAIASATQARREFLALGDVRGAGKVSLNLGALHVQRGDYAQAAQHSREAVVLFARVGDRAHSVMADLNLADALASMGDFDESLRIYARARMRAATHGLPVQQAHADMSVALLQLARGRYRDALSGFELSRGQYEKLAMPQELATAEKQLADAYLELHLLPEALALFDQVLLRFEALTMSAEQAWTLAQRGRVLALLGQPGPARQAFERAAALFVQQGNAAGAASVELARAELALDEGEATEAVDHAGRAATGFIAAGLADGHCRADVARARGLLRAGSIEQARALFGSALTRARELQLLTVQVRCLTGQGQAAQRLGEPATAETAFLAAVELFEDQRQALPGEELRNAFLGDHLRPYLELLRLAMDRHAQAPSPVSAAQVLQQLERYRARSMSERLGQGAAFDAVPSAPGSRDRLNWLYRRVQQLEDEGESAAALGEELRRTERELLEGNRRARLLLSQPELVEVAEHEVDVTRLQDLLSATDALVEYGVLDDELFACVVTRDSISVHRQLASWAEVLEALQAARFQIDTLRHGAAPVQHHLPALAARTQLRMGRLHALVWAPLATVLSRCEQVLVVPHGPLGSLPFAALSADGVCLGELCAIALVPSARLALRGLQRQPTQARRALVLGESSRLPHAAHEAQLVAGLFPEGLAFVGAQATIGTLQAHAAHADVVHLACHAQFRSDSPLFSALQLHDGPLTVEQAESLPLRPGVVVLSACETGLADLGCGDEMVGLVRAFLVAGAARVVASLWPVDDAVTADFMARFYGALCLGRRPAAALRQAQAELRQQHPHPFYWAAFTLYGGW